jgi:hypothetical protein
MSLPSTILYIETSKSPRSSLVASGSSDPLQFNDLIVGDTVNLAYVFTNNNIVDTNVSGSTVSLQSSIGNYTTLYASSSIWIQSSSYWTGSLSLNNAVVNAAVVGQTNLSAIFQIKAFDTNNQTTRSYAQCPVKIYNKVL